MTQVQLKAVRKEFGSFVALEHIDLDIQSGELVALLGPSGCGKTTTLRMISGLDNPTSGEIYFDGRDVSDVPVRDRNVGMVFQRYALFPQQRGHLEVGPALAETARRDYFGIGGSRRVRSRPLALEVRPIPADYPATYQVDEALCDGLDNDCDGSIDETHPTKGQICYLGTGACQRAGTRMPAAAMNTGTGCHRRDRKPPAAPARR